jgi:hypothetical protein
MTSVPSLAKNALTTGEYYLVDIDSVLQAYAAQGFDTADEEAEVPNVLTIDGKECFFTGDLVRRGDVYYEVVVVAKDFTWDEVESDDVDPELDD